MNRYGATDPGTKFFVRRSYSRLAAYARAPDERRMAGMRFDSHPSKPIDSAVWREKTVDLSDPGIGLLQASVTGV